MLKHILWLVCFVAHLSSLPAQKKITVIGVGRLGLCAALVFEKAGYTVMGIDINPTYVENLNNKTFVSLEPDVNRLLQESSNFKASCSLDEGLNFSDMYYITVDTPTKTGEAAYDHTNLNKVLTEINRCRVQNKTIVIACTIFPGYVATMGKAFIKDCINTTLSYNPSFIAQGGIVSGLTTPDIVLIGEASPAAGDLIEALHVSFCCNKPHICRMSPTSAEIAKIAINCFITTKIAYANMIGDIADKTTDADKETILAAIGKDSRIGAACLKAGYGFGGPCFPRDNRALGSYASSVGIEPVISYATDIANKMHAEVMAANFLLQNKDRYIFESVTYKDNCKVPIIDESQKLVVASQLARAGKSVVIVDIQPVITEVQKKYGDLFTYEVRRSDA